MRHVAMLDLATEYELFRDELSTTVHAVLESQKFINGPAVVRFEDELRRRIGSSHAVAVSSGTDALLCSLMALEVGAGDEVIVPSFTFFATAGAVWRTGARPVFVDIDPKTFTISVEAVQAAITSRTRAVIPVHLFGQCADMDELASLARQHDLTLIEDAAQALGAQYRGRSAGTLGDLACASFYPTKNLGGLGEGGMIFTDSTDLADLVRQLRNHGESERYVHERVGGNFRLDTLKAAILLVKLAYWEEFTRRRQENARAYNEQLAGVPVGLPFVAPGRTHVYHQYTIRTPQRDALKEFLAARGVQSAIYYPIPLHLQKCFEGLGHARGSLPESEAAAREVLSLPCHPTLSDDDVTYVCEQVRLFFAGAEAGDASRSASATASQG